MSTWANSGLTNAASTGAMLALGRTTPLTAAPDPRRSHRVVPTAPAGRRELLGEVPEPDRRGGARRATGPVRSGEGTGGGQPPRHPSITARPDMARFERGHVTARPDTALFEHGYGGARPVNPTDGFLAGGVTAVAAARIPQGDPDAGDIGTWGVSAPLTAVPVVPAPPLPVSGVPASGLPPLRSSGPGAAVSGSVSESVGWDSTPLTPLAFEPSLLTPSSFGSDLVASDPLGSDLVTSDPLASNLVASDLVGSGSVGSGPAASHRSALSSLDTSGLFNALSQVPR